MSKFQKILEAIKIVVTALAAALGSYATSM